MKTAIGILLLGLILFAASLCQAQNSSLTLGWIDNSDNETFFQLQNGPPEGPFKDFNHVGANVTQATVGGLNEATQYCFKVGALNDAGRSTFIGPVCAVTKATLTVAKAGAGSGSVVSVPAGINCGSVCAGKVPGNAVIALAATPAAGSTFAGWSGGCTGTGPCNLTMNGPKTATATFTASTPKPNPPGSLKVTGECTLPTELADGSCVIVVPKVPTP